MRPAQDGDTVRVHYTGKLEDGTVFDTSLQRDPLQFTLGSRQVITGFESAVRGMSPGETRHADVPAEQCYGPRRKELIVEVNRSQLPDTIEPVVGQKLEIHGTDGKAIPALVADVSDSTVTLDANHPLAGRPLAFDLELLEIV